MHCITSQKLVSWLFKRNAHTYTINAFDALVKNTNRNFAWLQKVVYEKYNTEKMKLVFYQSLNDVFTLLLREFVTYLFSYKGVFIFTDCT